MTAKICYAFKTRGQRLVNVVTGSKVFGLQLHWPVVSLDWIDNYPLSLLKTQMKVSCHLVLYEKGYKGTLNYIQILDEYINNMTLNSPG
jgi:hypothetical protein